MPVSGAAPSVPEIEPPGLGRVQSSGVRIKGLEVRI